MSAESPSTGARAILRIEGLSKSFGGVRAVQGLGLEVREGTITSLIGPNGAGKTTVFNMLTGVYRATSGRIHFLPKASKDRGFDGPLDMSFWQVGALFAGAIAIGACASWAGTRATGYAFWGAAGGVLGFAGAIAVVFTLGQRVLPRKRRGEFEELTHRRLDVLQAMLFQLAAAGIGLLAGRTALGVGAGTWLAWVVGLTALSGVLWASLQAGREALFFILSPDEVNRLGMARTFQNIRLFHDLSVLDNVKAGLHTHTPLFGEERRGVEASALRYLDFVGLLDRSHEVAANLAYGDQRRVEIARALATHPNLLLLDEPAAGLNPQEKEGLVALIRRIRDSGVTVFLIEHDMKLVMGISDVVWVLDHGELIAKGSPAAVQKDPRVIEAYLGVGDAGDAA